MSVNSGDQYAALIDNEEQKPQQIQVELSKGDVSWTFVLLICAMVAVFAAIVFGGFLLTRVDVEEPYDRSVAYQQPSKFTAFMTMKIPYFDEKWSMPITAHVDHDAGYAKVSYYNGANTFIYSKHNNTDNYSIGPVYDRLVCTKSHHDGTAPFPTLFPKFFYYSGETPEDDDDDVGPKLTTTLAQLMDGTEKTKIVTFKLENKPQTLNGVKCDVWSYINNAKANVTWDELEPDAFGYAGEYTFYVNAKTGAPVRFAQVGHNVFQQGSHIEPSYIIDYDFVEKVKHFAPGTFQPPVGMVCTEQEDEMARAAAWNIIPTVIAHPEKAQKTSKDLFDMWSTVHQKVYTSAQEQEERRAAFFTTAKMIAAHNASPEKSYKMALNQFADRTPAELRAMTQGRRSTPNAAAMLQAGPLGDKADACTQYEPIEPETPLPEALDWRTHEKLRDLLNTTRPGPAQRLTSQMSCGSCWAQGLTRAIATDHYLSSDKVLNVDEVGIPSVQYFLDCSTSYGNHACQGGLDNFGASYALRENNGLVAEDNTYGWFKNANGFCHYSVTDAAVGDVNRETGQQVKAFAKLTGCQHVGNQWDKDQPQDQDKLIADLKNALYHHGPVSISIAVPQSLYYYVGGVYDDAECGNQLDDLTHTVTAVGYTKDEIIFINSWSSFWGDEGAAYIKAKGNVCGVATTPIIINTTPVV